VYFKVSTRFSFPFKPFTHSYLIFSFGAIGCAYLQLANKKSRISLKMTSAIVFDLWKRLFILLVHHLESLAERDHPQNCFDGLFPLYHSKVSFDPLQVMVYSYLLTLKILLRTIISPSLILLSFQKNNHPINSCYLHSLTAGALHVLLKRLVSVFYQVLCRLWHCLQL
jgi:hypothetical protein